MIWFPFCGENSDSSIESELEGEDIGYEGTS